ncbi:hypothetical protein [Pandoraea oxalativorans]|uniref:hypothetical protein n=1 Tax=Pandoraea oxalativorans TaxID=573737 RepID=UPI0012F4C3FF|nr:hypothetical protein [Pandoraea oxalativorans]
MALLAAMWSIFPNTAKAVTPDCINATNADSDIFIKGKNYYQSGGAVMRTTRPT